MGLEVGALSIGVVPYVNVFIEPAAQGHTPGCVQAVEAEDQRPVRADEVSCHRHVGPGAPVSGVDHGGAEQADQVAQAER